MTLKNSRQELFAQAVAKGETLERAYVAAGYNVKDNDARRAKASRLGSNGIVARRIKELKEKGVEKVLVEIADVVRGLLSIANADIADAFTPEGALKPIHEIPKALRLAIQSIDIDELFEREDRSKVHVGYTKKLRLNDRKGAWDSLGKYLKMFTDRIEHSGVLSLEQLVCAPEEE